MPRISSLTAYRLTKRIFLAFAGILGLLLLVIAVSLYFLPDIVGSNRFKSVLESKVSDSLNRPLHIQRVKWGWQNGLEINGLEIPDDPKFSKSPLVFIKHAGLRMDFSRLIKKRLGFVFLVSGIDLNIIRDTQGRVNITEVFSVKPEAEKTKPAKKTPPPKKQEKPFVLPLDISSRIRMNGISVAYDDRGRKKQFNVKNASIRLDVPSLKNEMASLAIDLDMAVNQRDIPHSSLTATVQNLFDANGALSINNLSFRLDADFPGTRAAFSGNIAESGITGDIKVDLATLREVIAPLVPDYAGRINIKGDIDLVAAVSGKPDKPVCFDARLNARDIGLSGQLLNGKSLDSGSIGLYAKGRFNQKDKTLLLENGEIAFLNNSRIQLSGSIKQTNSDGPFADFSIKPLVVDLDEGWNFFRQFLPAQLTMGEPNKKSLLAIDQLRFCGSLPDGPADIQLDDLSLRLPRINLSTDDNSISIIDLNLSHLTAKAQGIKKPKKTPFGVQADITLADALSIKQIRIPDQLDIHGLNQSLSAHAALNPDGSANVSIDQLDLNIHVSIPKNKPFGPVDAVCETNTKLSDFTLSGLNQPNIDINGLDTRINIDDMLLAHLRTGIVDSGNSGFNAEAEITTDLNLLFEKYLKKILPGISAAGKARLTIKAEGRRPDDKEIDHLKSLRFSGNLGFLDSLSIETRLSDGGLEVSQKDKNAISIASISGEPFIRYHLTGKNGVGSLNSHLLINGIKNIPEMRMRSPLSADISLNAAHRYLDSFDLNQRLTITPMGIKENARVSLDGLDHILSKKPLPKSFQWLSGIGITAGAGIEIPDCAKIKETGLPGMADIDVHGSVSGLARIQLMPGRYLDGGLKLVLNGVNLDMDDFMTINGINGNIDLSKRYLITAGAAADKNSKAAFLLSQQVIQSAFTGYAYTPPGNSNLNRHIGKLKDRLSITPDLSTGPARFESLPFPLVIDGSRFMLSLRDGLPNLDYFQIELLGGTMTGSLSLYKEQTGLFFESEINFSGINTALIFPEAFSGVRGSEAEISGYLYAKVPIKDKLRPLLDDTTITIAFTRIGSRALERILYALDPRESNEAIVSQRLLLRTGSPKRIRLTIKDGFLSLAGSVSIRSVTIPLPALRRLNISHMPGIERFGDNLTGFAPIISILNNLSARRLTINKKNSAIRFY